LTSRRLISFRRDLARPIDFSASGVRWPLTTADVPSCSSARFPSPRLASLPPSTRSIRLSSIKGEGRSRCPRSRPTTFNANLAFMIALLTNRTSVSAPTSGANWISIRTLARGAQPWSLVWSGISPPESMRRCNSWAAHAASSLVEGVVFVILLIMIYHDLSARRTDGNQ